MPDVNAGNIQFWRVIEATANLAISSIEMAKYSGNDAEALHSEGIAALRNQLQLVGVEMPSFSCTRSSTAQPLHNNRISSGSALEVAGEMLPIIREAIHQKGYDPSYGSSAALVISLMATSLGVRSQRQLGD